METRAAFDCNRRSDSRANRAAVDRRKVLLAVPAPDINGRGSHETEWKHGHPVNEEIESVIRVFLPDILLGNPFAATKTREVISLSSPVVKPA